MNPGGDFGKKELSPALRNRFTEIWVPPICDHEDLRSIVMDRLGQPELLSLADPLLQFWQWFQSNGERGRILSVRDLLSWVSFINTTAEDIGPSAAFVHGALLVLLDGLGLGTGLSSSAAGKLRTKSLEHLLEQLPDSVRVSLTAYSHLEAENLNPAVARGSGYEALPMEIERPAKSAVEGELFGIDPFFIPKGTESSQDVIFELSAPTTSWNALRILRAMQLRKPVLLEGSPGVGKTSLVTALAKSSGYKLVRINLSEQTDVVDLFGSDMPVEGGKSGEFCWSDGVFLQALKAGHWVLLDELNLASQSVLEGLNACLDHRGEVFIPELGLVFKCPRSFRVFACQNPVSQGGGRKGLPKSFLNRFTKVYVDALQEKDYLFIAKALHPSIPEDLLVKMVRFNAQVYDDTMVAHAYGHSGSPWEFNLRDILRWCELVEGMVKIWSTEVLVESFLDVLYLQRMRTKEDRQHILGVYQDVFGVSPVIETYPLFRINPEHLHVGKASLRRIDGTQHQRDSFSQLRVLPGFTNKLESLMHCVRRGWMCNLVGPVASGKTNLVRLLASATGNTLHEFALSSGTDITELLGCFEQYDPFRRWQDIVRRSYQSLEAICSYCLSACENALPVERNLNLVRSVLSSWAAFQKCLSSRDRSSTWTSVDREEAVLDPLSVNMLLQVLEQLIRISNVCKVSSLRASLQPHKLSESLKAVQQCVGEVQKLGRFEWIDGGLLQAIENGHWVLLENANLCNPTVLDRLNPLLEPDGTILINERGLVNGEAMLVRAHPNFRLFITVDPAYGEVSRAMRNRGVEIFMMEPNWYYPTLDESKAPAERKDIASESGYKLLVQAGIPSDSLVEAMFKAHTDMKTVTESSHGGIHISLRTLSHWISLLQQLLERGANFMWSITCSWVQTYVRHLDQGQARDAALQILHSRLTKLDLASGMNPKHPSLFVPGGWPSPHSLGLYCIRSRESCVKIDSMYVEQLVSEYISVKATKDWALFRESGLGNGQHLFWTKDKVDTCTCLSPVLLRTILHPLSEVSGDSLGNLDPHEYFSDVEIKLHHATLWMVEHGSISDIGLRAQWLKSLAAKLGGPGHILVNVVLALEKELQHAIGKELLVALEQLELSTGRAFDSNLIPYASRNSSFTPVEIQHSTNFEESRNASSQVSFLGRKLLLLRRTLLQWQKEDETYKSALGQVAGTITSPALQSYWHHLHGSARMAGMTSQIPKTLLKYIYPLFTSLRNFENEALTGTGFELWFTSVEVTLSRLLDWHEALWKILRDSVFSAELIMFCWVETKRALFELMRLDMPGIEKVAGSVRDIVYSLDDCFNTGQGSGFKPLLWKYGGRPRLASSKSLFEQEQLIFALCQKIWEASDQDAADRIASVNNDLRRGIIEGFSLSVWLRQRRLSKKLDQCVSTFESRDSLTSMTVHDAEGECAEIFAMILGKINAEKCVAETILKEICIPLSATAISGPDARPNRLTVCRFSSGHRTDVAELRDFMYLPSVQTLWLELIQWLDHVSAKIDLELLGHLSAASLSGLLACNLPMALRQGGLDAKTVQHALEFAVAQSSRSPLDFVPHQQILWILEGMTSKPADVIVSFEDINHEMWFRWHKAIWRTSSKDLGGKSEEWILTSGPPRFFLAAQSVVLSNELGQTAVPVKDYREKLLQLRTVIRNLWDLQKQRSPDMSELDLCNLSALFQQILLAHKKSFVPHDYEEMRNILSAMHKQTTKVELQNDQDGNKLLKQLESILRRSQHQGLFSITESLVVPCAQLLFSTSWTNLDASEMLLEHGRLWLLVGSIRLRLLLPADACDPVSMYHYKLAHNQEQLHNLNLEIEVRHKSEVYSRGSGRTDDITALLSRTVDFTQEMTNLSRKIIHRPYPSRFKDFCQEVQRFINLAADTRRLLGLWSQCTGKDGSSESHVGRCRAEVVSVQENCERFIQRLDRDFPAYRDFLQPVQQAVFELKFGLSLSLAGHLQQATIKSVGFQQDGVSISNLPSTLMEFPMSRSQNRAWANGRSTSLGVCSSYELLNNVTEQIVSWAALKQNIPSLPSEVAKMEMKVKILRIALLRIGHEILHSGITSRSTMERLEVCFSAFSSLWQEIREYRQERLLLEAQMSQFTTSTYNMDVEETIDEESFHSMFPDYKPDFGSFSDPQLGCEEDNERAEKANGISRTGDDVYAEKAWTQLEEALVKDVIHIHSLVFNSHVEGTLPVEVVDEQIVHTFVLSYDTGKQLLQTLGHCIPEAVDKRLLSSHLMRYSVEYHKLAGGSDGYTPTASRFTDTNAFEVATMLDPIAKYLHRVEGLLIEWPEHPILLQLSQLSKKLLSFSLNTVVMKALTGVELLLSKSQLWEENAAKHVSIADELRELSRLVTHWRKMELEEWSALLEKTEEKHILSANKLWFSLYGLLNRPVGDDVGAHLELTTSSMEQFMQTATLGEFRARLQLVRAFYCHISAQMTNITPLGSPSRAVREGLSNLLYNVLNYYSQFLPTLDEILSSGKGVIEKELKDFVRLSKWDDRSYYTLSFSSEKTHRKLHKLVKKYDELLGRSVVELVTKQASRLGSQTLSSLGVRLMSDDGLSRLVIEASGDEHVSSKKLHRTGPKKKSELISVGFSAEEWKKRYDNKMRQLAVVAPQLPAAVTEAGSYRDRLPALTSKIAELLAESLFIEADSPTQYEGADSLEVLATSVIIRSAELREGKKGLAVKKKAMTDLLKILRQVGLSHRKSVVPKEQRTPESWLLLRPAEAGNMLYYDRRVPGEQTDLDTKLKDACVNLWNKASDYYYKNMALIQHLHRLSLDFNKDLSLREVDLCKRYVEHLLFIQQRQRQKAHELGAKLGQLGQLKDVLSSSGRGLPRQRVVRKWLWQQKALFDSLWQVTTETLLLIKTSERTQICPENQMKFEADGIRISLENFVAGLQSCKIRLDNHLIPRNEFYTANKEMFPIFCTSGMFEDLSANFVFLSGTEASLKDLFKLRGTHSIIGLQPLERLLFEGYAMVQEFGEEIQTSSTVEQSSTLVEPFAEFSSLTEKAISELLLAVQAISRDTTGRSAKELKADNEESCTSEASSELGTIEDMELSTLERSITSRLDRVLQALIKLLCISEKLIDHPNSGEKSSASVGRVMNCIHVPLDMLHVAGMRLLLNYISLHKTVTKLGYVLANLFVSLFTEGFCKTKEEEAEGLSKFEDDAKGTGMGEGEGKKDVSEQIEDEEQLLGDSEQDKDVPKEDGGKKPDKGVEMEQDFSGDMVDLSDDESEEEEDIEKDQDEKLESRMDENFEDKEIVDEKLWNGDDENENVPPEGKEKYERESAVTGARPEDLEIRGKEGTDEEDAGKGEMSEQRKSEPEMKTEVKPEMESEYDVEAANMEETLEDASGIKPTVEETLEFPEDLELDGEENEQDVDGDPEDTKDADDVPKGAGSDMNFPEAMDIDDDTHGESAGSEDRDEKDDVDGDKDEAGEEDSSALETEREKEIPTGDTKDEEPELAQERNDVDGPFQNEPKDEPQELPGEKGKSSQTMDARTSCEFSEMNNVIPGLTGNSSGERTEENIMEKGGMTEVPRQDKLQSGVDPSSVANPDGADRTDSRSEPPAPSAGQNPDKPHVNPCRSLGDALKQWKERINVFDSNEQTGEVEKEPTSGQEEVLEKDESAGEYEFLAREDDPGVSQALSAATKEQLDEILAQSGKIERKSSDDVMQEPQLEKVDEQMDEAPRTLEDGQIVAKNKSRLSRAEQESSSQSDGPLEEEIERNIGLLGLEEPESTNTLEGSQVLLEAKPVEASRALSLVNSEESWSEEGISRMRKELEVGLRDSGGNIEAARVTWQKYEHLTARLSQELAEQLRLILDPTLATRLEGDYRSGKRINMKKIIPYIASQFRKDKIWLRRTKANKRQYQVVLAIDDSRSMSESHCGHMALEALITICRAMSQVEIGQMAVASFGEKGNVQLLHDFDHTFSSEAGVNLVSRFSFAQDNTIADEPMVDLLHFLTRMLEVAARNAAAPSGNLSLQQLVLIIADGRFHEKESLRRCVREAISRKQLLAFIVLDNPQESILDMQSVSFSNGAPSFTKYLDSFPFPYYILLREIESLPRTLADLLRQWFELTQRSSG